MSSQTRINELQASRFPPEHLRTPGPPLPTQRTLFGENPTPPTVHDRHSWAILRKHHLLLLGKRRMERPRCFERHRTPLHRQDRPRSGPPPGKAEDTPYEGNTDPRQYLTAFCIAMGRTHFSEEERDAGFCQLFVENLSGSALTWFSRLESRSIDSYHQLTTAFLKQYSMYIRRGVSCADLWALSQGPKDSLRKFIDKFKGVASRLTATVTKASRR
ncbi:unnamed protein product [Microthlaspi erraticum]|uniref:Retrotransposon gag domain-containing protein n=1 Tax=Microthlaspi erraticum TaxID=1685480 RepID=A0A6D2IFY1_9BRAS|nr:unnamed protein product [Microthlaspi erraticum]